MKLRSVYRLSSIICFICLFSCVYSAHLDADLIWWYDLEEGDGTLAEDEEGNNDGTLAGAEWIEPGAPLSPDYAIAYTNLGANMDLGTSDWTEGGSNATIALWLHWNGIGSGRDGNLNHIMRKYASWQFPDGGMFVWEVDIAGLHRINLTSGNRLIFNTPLPSGEWVHVAVVVDGSTGITTGYLNGNPDISGNFRFGSKRDDLLLVGGSADKTFNGAMDDIRFYDTQLTAEEVQALAVPEPAVTVYTLLLLYLKKRGNH